MVRRSAGGSDVRLNVVAVLAPGSAYDYSILMPIEDVIAFNEWTNNADFDPETFVFGRVTVRARDATR